MRIKSVRVATTTAFVSMFFLGIGVAIVGATARSVGLAASQIGYLVAAQNAGFAIAVVAGGILADRYRKSVILTAGLLMLGLSFALLYRSERFAANLAVMSLMGLGMGCAEAVTDAMLLEMHTRNESRLVTLNHFFVSAGSVVITLYLMALELNWQSALLQIAIALGALGVVATLLHPPGQEAAAPEGGVILRELWRDPGIILLFLAGMGTIGLEVGSAGVITTFATELRDLDPRAAQIVLTLFLVGLAAGRILVGVIGRGTRPEATALVSAAAAVVLSILFYVVSMPFAALLLFASLVGLSIAPLLPLTIAIAGLRHRSAAGTTMGFIKLAIPVGGIVIPGVVGLTSDLLSFQTALYLFPASALLVLIATIAAPRVGRGPVSPQ